MIINKPATIISKRETVMSVPDAVMSGPHIIIYRHDAMMSALETVICAAETSISRADIAISAFDRSFLAAEISISAAGKTAGGAPAGLFPIASHPEIESKCSLELNGVLDEPVRDVVDIEVLLYPEDEIRVGPARPVLSVP